MFKRIFNELKATYKKPGLIILGVHTKEQMDFAKEKLPGYKVVDTGTQDDCRALRRERRKAIDSDEQTVVLTRLGTMNDAEADVVIELQTKPGDVEEWKLRITKCRGAQCGLAVSQF